MISTLKVKEQHNIEQQVVPKVQIKYKVHPQKQLLKKRSNNIVLTNQTCVAAGCWNAGEFTPETRGRFIGVREKCCLFVSLSMAFKVSIEVGLDKEIWGVAKELLGSKELFKLVI